MNKKIDDALDMVPLNDTSEKNDVVQYEEPKVPQKSEPTEKERDLKFARDNLIGLISHGSEALEELMDVAQQSQHPRAYEVLSTMIKTMIDANKDLLEVSEKKNPEPVEEKSNTTVNNNHLYVGSTADLHKLLTANNKNESDT